MSRVSAASTNRRTREHITSKSQIEQPDAGDACQQWRARLVQEPASTRGLVTRTSRPKPKPNVTTQTHSTRSPQPQRMQLDSHRVTIAMCSPLAMSAGASATRAHQLRPLV